MLKTFPPGCMCFFWLWPSSGYWIVWFNQFVVITFVLWFVLNKRKPYPLSISFKPMHHQSDSNCLCVIFFRLDMLKLCLLDLTVSFALPLRGTVAWGRNSEFLPPFTSQLHFTWKVWQTQEIPWWMTESCDAKTMDVRNRQNTLNYIIRFLSSCFFLWSVWFASRNSLW